jgi:hypothetical protein
MRAILKSHSSSITAVQLTAIARKLASRHGIPVQVGIGGPQEEHFSGGYVSLEVFEADIREETPARKPDDGLFVAMAMTAMRSGPVHLAHVFDTRRLSPWVRKPSGYRASSSSATRG